MRFQHDLRLKNNLWRVMKTANYFMAGKLWLWLALKNSFKKNWIHTRSCCLDFHPPAHPGFRWCQRGSRSSELSTFHLFVRTSDPTCSVKLHCLQPAPILKLNPLFPLFDRPRDKLPVLNISTWIPSRQQDISCHSTYCTVLLRCNSPQLPELGVEIRVDTWAVKWTRKKKLDQKVSHQKAINCESFYLSIF